MNNAKIIKERLVVAFNPTLLEVIDDSDAHRGHAGHQGGGRHFTISIASTHFANMPKVASHRKIYELFIDLIPEKIHALSIKIL